MDNNIKTAEEIPFQELMVSKYVTVFMPHFNQNVRLKIETRAVWDSDNVCIRLHGRAGKNVIVSEPIFSQEDLNKMSHIFQPIKP